MFFNRFKAMYLVGVVVFLTMLACNSWPASPSIADIAAELRPSTVMIRAQLPETPISYASVGSGTGIVWGENGYIITNAHVVEGASAVTMSIPGSERRRAAHVVGISTCDDLAVLKVDNTDGLKAAKLGKSGEMRVGEEVLALGYPLGDILGIDPSATQGIISRLDAIVPGQPHEGLIQTDTTINHGNSGGPLVNMHSEVIGINTLGLDAIGASQTNFAISLDQSMGILEELKDGNRRHWVGLNLVQNAAPQTVEYFGYRGGLIVQGVESGGPASRIEVEPVDLLTKLEGSVVNSQADVCRILRSHQDGDRLKIELLRVKKEEACLMNGEITIGKTDDEVSPLKASCQKNSNTSSAGDPEEESSASNEATPVAVTTPDNYIRITDDSKSVAVEVPKAWASVDGRPLQDDQGNVAGVTINAARNVDKFLNSEPRFSIPGVRVVVSKNQTDPAQFLEDFGTPGYMSNCTAGPSQGYEDDHYSGYYHLFTDCGVTGGKFLVIALTSNTQRQSHFVFVLARDMNSDDANHLLKTLTVVDLL